MLLCREMHSFNGLVHVCMQWLARNEQGRGTVVPLMRLLTWECDGARAQRFFLKSVQDVSEVIGILGSFPAAMYCEKILGFCNWRPRDIDNFVFTEHQFSAVQARYRFYLRSLDLEHSYQEWAAVYSDDEDEVVVTTLADWPLPTRDEIVGRIFTFLVPWMTFPPERR